MRVFPVVSGQPTRIRLTVGMPADAVAGTLRFTLPLDLGKVDKFSMKVTGDALAKSLPTLTGLKALTIKKTKEAKGVSSFEGSFTAKNYLPPDGVTLTVIPHSRAKISIRRADGDDARYFEAHVFPKELTAETRPDSTSATIVWDYSLSEEGSHDERPAALKR